MNTFIDTIVCMENTDVVGAFLAAELLKDGAPVINSGGNISVITPMNNISGKLIFHDSEHGLIKDKSILLLLATVSSGRTLESAFECLGYYGGKVVGISTLFLRLTDKPEHEFHSLFTSNDIEGYAISGHSECPMCKEGIKLDAIVSSDGYTKIPG
jgi:orotate phosphoribosyltransferase